MTGSHIPGRSNSDVTGFVTGSKELKVIPSGIGNYFPNIQSLTLQSTSISSINKNDLKEFPNLKALEIFDSNLEVIPADCFQNNPHLEWIDLHLNKIASIDGKVFDGLVNLKSLFLDRNVCIDRFAPKNRDKVLELIEEVKAKC